MTQSSYTIDNKAGALVRADLNTLAAAIQSGNSGATAPTDTRGGMVWVDTSTTPATLRIRNVADNAWIAVGTLGSTFGVAGLVQLTQAQAEDSASVVFGMVNGQLLDQQTNAAFNVTGAAPKYACRAWVNFDGGTTPPIVRASGNVSSVTRSATGSYSVNLTTSMPDANYIVVATSSLDAGSGQHVRTGGLAVGSFGLVTTDPSGTAQNSGLICAAIFR